MCKKLVCLAVFWVIVLNTFSVSAAYNVVDNAFEVTAEELIDELNKNVNIYEPIPGAEQIDAGYISVVNDRFAIGYSSDSASGNVNGALLMYEAIEQEITAADLDRFAVYSSALIKAFSQDADLSAEKFDFTNLQDAREESYAEGSVLFGFKVGEEYAVFMVSVLSNTGETDVYSVSINKSLININNPLHVIDGVVYVPLRDLLGVLSVEPGWKGETMEVSFEYGDKAVSMQIGESEFIVNGENFAAGGEVLLINGYTYVPVKALCQAIGANVTCDEASRSVNITVSELN